MHTLGIMLAAAGQYERYDMLQRSQAQVKCKGDGNPVLPPLESHEGLQGLAKFCNHPLCQLVYRHALESTRVATALTPTLDWDRNEPWAFGPKHPSGASKNPRSKPHSAPSTWLTRRLSRLTHPRALQTRTAWSHHSRLP